MNQRMDRLEASTSALGFSGIVSWLHGVLRSELIISSLDGDFASPLLSQHGLSCSNGLSLRTVQA